jgi:hypothetical protein
MTTSSGLTLDDTTATVQGRVQRHNSRASGYANRLRYRFGSGKASQSQAFVAAGVAAPGGIETYTVDYPIVSQDINDPWPNQLIVNGVVVGVVSWGDARPTFWYWWDATTGALKIDQALAGITAAGASIAVAYTAQFPATLTVEDAVALAADGHPIERLVVDEGTNDLDSATDFANAELRRALGLGATVVTVKHRAGMAYPGETISLHFAQHNISGTFMVTNVRVTDDVDGALVFEHECIGGSEQPDTWLDTFRDGVAGGSGSSSIATGGTVSRSVLATPFVFGGHDLGSFSAPDWTRSQASTRFTSTDDFTAVVSGEAWARDATVAVTARLRNVTDSTDAGTSLAATTTTRHNPVSFTASIVAGKTYELQVKATTVPVGKTDQVFANGWQMKAA